MAAVNKEMSLTSVVKDMASSQRLGPTVARAFVAPIGSLFPTMIQSKMNNEKRQNVVFIIIMITMHATHLTWMDVSPTSLWTGSKEKR